MWAIIKHALNSTLGTRRFRPLNELGLVSSHSTYYNVMNDYVCLNGDANGRIVVVPNSTVELGVSMYDSNATAEIYVLPETSRIIHAYAFYKNTSLKNIVFPPLLKSIGARAFQGCNSLSKVIIPESVKTISGLSFSDCTELKTVIIRGKPEMSETIFSGCEKLTDIYVAWAQDEIANAPWGAMNATIHYHSEV